MKGPDRTTQPAEWLSSQGFHVDITRTGVLIWRDGEVPKRFPSTAEAARWADRRAA